MALIMGQIERSEVNGPGTRAVLHFQGCDLGCKGCWNPGSHAFDTKKAADFDALKQWILDRKDVEGITFSGGEPMQQAQYLYLLADFIKTNRPNWSIMMFTGYTLKELEGGKYKWRQESDGTWVEGTALFWNEIKKHLDLIVAGRYNESKRTASLPLRGSENQEVIFLSDRYTEADLKPQEFEFNIAVDGLVKITGFPVGVDIEGIFSPKEEDTVIQKVPHDEDYDQGELVGA